MSKVQYEKWQVFDYAGNGDYEIAGVEHLPAGMTDKEAREWILKSSRHGDYSDKMWVSKVEEE